MLCCVVSIYERISWLSNQKLTSMLGSCYSNRVIEGKSRSLTLILYVYLHIHCSMQIDCIWLAWFVFMCMELHACVGFYLNFFYFQRFFSFSSFFLSLVFVSTLFDLSFRLIAKAYDNSLTVSEANSHIKWYMQITYLYIYMHWLPQHQGYCTVSPSTVSKWQCGSCEWKEEKKNVIEVEVNLLGTHQYIHIHTNTLTDTEQGERGDIHATRTVVSFSTKLTYVHVHGYTNEWNKDGKWWQNKRYNWKWKTDVYALDGHRSTILLQLYRETFRVNTNKRTNGKKKNEFIYISLIDVDVDVGTEGAFLFRNTQYCWAFISVSLISSLSPFSLFHSCPVDLAFSS